MIGKFFALLAIGLVISTLGGAYQQFFKLQDTPGWLQVVGIAVFWAGIVGLGWCVYRVYRWVNRI